MAKICQWLVCRIYQPVYQDGGGGGERVRGAPCRRPELSLPGGDVRGLQVPRHSRGLSPAPSEGPFSVANSYQFCTSTGY